MSKIYGLDKGYAFRKTSDTSVEIVKIADKDSLKDKNLIMSQTPRVMVHAEEETSNSSTVKNVRVEFTSWIFPTRYFNMGEDRVLTILGKPYKLVGWNETPWSALVLG